MKNFFCFLIFYLFPIYIYSQNITVDELATLRKKSFTEVEEYLSNKNWSFLNGEDLSSDKMGSATFSLNKKDFDDNAESFFEFLYDNSENEESCNHKFFLQFFDKSKYNTFINRFKTLGCKLIKSKIENGNIVKIYQGSTTTFQISTIADKDIFGVTNTRYSLLVLGNIDYFIFYDDDPSLRELLEKQMENEKLINDSK
ncbi:hypothetical protein AB9T89_01205 [Flavobacterium oncorhynchi]|uniref:hypothetical protein n=1 Tax=Flavobacterium oncorhynchi TaxID=728056 RepID=UPI00351A38FC